MVRWYMWALLCSAWCWPLAAQPFNADPVVKVDVAARLHEGFVQIAIQFTIPAEHHLFAPGTPPDLGIPLHIELRGQGVSWRPPLLPAAKSYAVETYDERGKIAVPAYYGVIRVYALGKLPGESQQLPADLAVNVRGMFCSEGEGAACYAIGENDGMTYPAQPADEAAFSEFPAASAFSSTPASSPASSAASQSATDSSPAAQPQPPSMASEFNRQPLWAFVLAAIGAGIFALVMPCTYPMIPITISFFSKQAEQRGGSVLPLSLAYGAGIVGIFTLLGLAAGLISGASQQINDFATNPWVNLAIGVLFTAFALALFGCYELNPPSFLLDASSHAQRTGGYIGVFLMGATLVVTSFTCTAPFVGSLLAAAIQGGLERCLIGMAVFGLTMALPFVVLSLMPGYLARMPRSGGWMSTIKVTLGFVELAAALKFFSNAELKLGTAGEAAGILPFELFLLLWAVIAFSAAAYLFGWINLKGEANEGIGPARMTWGVFALLLASYFAYGTAGYSVDWITTAIAPPYHAERTGAHAQPPTSTPGADPQVAAIVEDDFAAALALARQQRKRLLVNFTGVI
jgi:thiol:disulfide interchange protein DsbD